MYKPGEKVLIYGFIDSQDCNGNLAVTLLTYGRNKVVRGVSPYEIVKFDELKDRIRDEHNDTLSSVEQYYSMFNDEDEINISDLRRTIKLLRRANDG